MLVGLVSDTHGTLRPEVLEELEGVDHILHAGDVGSPDVLQGLRAVAPVTAVRGNMDRDAWARRLRKTKVVELGGVLVYLLHDLGQLDLDPAAAGFGAVISGHSHRPLIERRAGVLFVNPGSAGPRRFRWPVSLGFLYIEDESLDARIVELDV
jgi:hypothetical protein